MYLYFKVHGKMKQITKQKLIYKKEADRTKVEKIVRDVAFYGLVVYVAVLGFMLVDANIDLTNAQVDIVNNSIMTHSQLN